MYYQALNIGERLDKVALSTDADCLDLRDESDLRCAVAFPKGQEQFSYGVLEIASLLITLDHLYSSSPSRIIQLTPYYPFTLSTPGSKKVVKFLLSKRFTIPYLTLQISITSTNPSPSGSGSPAIPLHLTSLPTAGGPIIPGGGITEDTIAQFFAISIGVEHIISIVPNDCIARGMFF